MKNMRFFFIFFVTVFSILQIVDAAENEYGIANAWFNGKNATVEGVQLKVGEPAEIKVEVISKINGHIFVKLTEPGVTKAFDIINGPSNQDERIDNLNIVNEWSKTFDWKIKPNGAWKKGNAPINIFVSFYNLEKDSQKPIQFTIANPYILDEQYTGTAASTTQAPEITDTGAASKPAPFISSISVIVALILARRRGR